MSSRSEIIDIETKTYIDSLDMNNLPYPLEMGYELVEKINDKLALDNQIRPRDNKHKLLQNLPAECMYQLVKATSIIRKIKLSDGDGNTSVLGFYVESGDSEGIYETSEAELHKLCYQYNRHVTKTETREVIDRFNAEAEEIKLCSDRDIIPLHNGLFDYSTKELKPFSPDYAFLTKFTVDFNPNAQNVILTDDNGNKWDVISFMNSLTDDPETVKLLWQVVGAALRYNCEFDKAVMFYSRVGKNGKGTLLSLMKNIIGTGAYASIDLTKFGKQFALQPLIRKSIVLCDEVPVNGYLDDCSFFKCAVTGDDMIVEGKFKDPVNISKRFFICCCINDLPRMRDTSPSAIRRLLFIDFPKSFEGHENKDIKSKYLKNKDVLEFVVKYVLTKLDDYYEFDIPERSQALLKFYIENNDPVYSFFIEIESKFVWDLVPYKFAYDLYVAWYKKVNPSGKIEGRNSFIEKLRDIVRNSNKWEICDKNVRSAGLMNCPEPLILDYDMVDWKNSNYTGPNPNMICTPKLNDFYRGLLRKNCINTITNDEDSTETDN